MVRKVPLPGGDLEYAVLVALWDLGTASAPEIHRRVGEPQGSVYTTTAKVLDRLHAKRLVSRVRVGKSFVYKATLAREVVERARVTQALGRVLRPDVRPAIATLVDAVESIDPELLDELSRQVEARRRSRRGS
jgi:BlaI family transcriptional regulator, penicillinase repressor